MKNYTILKLLKNRDFNSLNEIRKEASYIPFVFVDYQFEISLCDYDLEKLLEAHETGQFLFNINCLKYHRNSVIIYCSKDKFEKVKSNLETALRDPSRSSYFLEEKQAKQRVLSRSERGYRKQIFAKFLPNLSFKDKKVLTTFFDEMTDPSYLLVSCAKKLNQPKIKKEEQESLIA